MNMNLRGRRLGGSLTLRVIWSTCSALTSNGFCFSRHWTYSCSASIEPIPTIFAPDWGGHGRNGTKSSSNLNRCTATSTSPIRVCLFYPLLSCALPPDKVVVSRAGTMKQLYEWVSTQRKNHRKRVLKKVQCFCCYSVLVPHVLFFLHKIIRTAFWCWMHLAFHGQASGSS